MKKYEGLFILNTAGREEGVKEMLDKVTADITAAGGKVETVQKMDKKAFSRVASKKATSGYYANVIFTIDPKSLPTLPARFTLNPDVFRVMFTIAPPQLAAPAPAV